MMRRLTFLLLFFFICGFSAHTQSIKGAEKDGLSENLEVFKIGDEFFVKDSSKYLSWDNLKPFNGRESQDVKEIVKVFVIMNDVPHRIVVVINRIVARIL